MKILRFLLVVGFLSVQAYGIQEQWYWEFSLGPSFGSYSDLGASKSSTDTRYGSASEVAFYFPVSEDGNTVIGPAIDVTSSHYESPTGRHGMLAFSIMRSFGKEPGDNLFVRGDIGLGDLEYGVFDEKAGIGFVGSIGYGFTVSEQTRFILQLRGHVTLTSSGKASSLAFVFGPMF